VKNLLQDVARRAEGYIENLPYRRVGPTPEDLEALEALNGPLPEHPTSADEVLDLLDRYGSKATVASTGGRYFGFVTGGALPATLAANWMAGAWDQNAFSHANSPVAVILENIALGWMTDLFHLSPGTGGALVTGATMANFTGLAAGRHALLQNAGWDVEEKGLFGAPAFPVIVGAEAHPTLYKSLALLGLGRNRVITVPVDDQGRMRADAFPTLDTPAIVCLQAGNVNTGAFDPIAELCKRTHAAGGWVHIDGAFGLWTRIVPDLAHLTDGLEQADSMATDGHKWLNVPYDCGIAFVKNPTALRETMAISAAYLPQTAQREPRDYNPESSRRARGIEVWAAIRSLGREGLAGMIERNCRLTRRFADRLKTGGCEILNDVVLNQALVSFGTPEKTLATVKRIQEDGTCWCGSTVWQGKTAMRISVSSWATTEADIDHSAEAILRCARA